MKSNRIVQNRRLLPNIKLVSLQYTRALHSAPDLVESIWESAKDSYAKHSFKQALKFTEKLRALMRGSNDTLGLESTCHLAGNIYFDLKDYHGALTQYQHLKVLAGENQSLVHKIVAYKQLGLCFIEFKHYRSAVISFKKMLQLTWYIERIPYELISYDYLGLVYYYLGDLERSRYYHERMWKGIYEDKRSSVRMNAVRNLELQLARRKESPRQGALAVDDVFELSGDESDLPSPKTSSVATDLRPLPHTSQRKPQFLVKSASTRRLFPVVEASTGSKPLGAQSKPFILYSHLSSNDPLNLYISSDQRVKEFKRVHTSRNAK